MYVRWDLYGPNQEHLMLFNRQQRQLYVVPHYEQLVGGAPLIELGDASKDGADMGSPVAAQVLARLADPKTRPLITVLDSSQLMSLTAALNSVMLLGVPWLSTPSTPRKPKRPGKPSRSRR